VSSLPVENDQRLQELEDETHRQISAELETEMEAGTLAGLPGRDALMERVRRLIEAQSFILTEKQQAALARFVVDRTIGLGPLEPLLEDATIDEIMVNDVDNVFIERDGRLEQVNVRFRDEAHLRHVIDRIVAPIGRPEMRHTCGM